MLYNTIFEKLYIISQIQKMIDSNLGRPLSPDIIHQHFEGTEDITTINSVIWHAVDIGELKFTRQWEIEK